LDYAGPVEAERANPTPIPAHTAGSPGLAPGPYGVEVGPVIGAAGRDGGHTEGRPGVPGDLAAPAFRHRGRAARPPVPRPVGTAVPVAGDGRPMQALLPRAAGMLYGGASRGGRWP